MDFQTTPIQRDFYIEELFNSDSNSKYSLNFIFKLESSNALSIDQVRQSIVDVIQNQPIMSGIADIKDSNVIIRKEKLKNSVVEIETVQNSNIIFEDDSIFQHTFSLIDHQPLFRCKLIDKEGSLYILLAVHHFVFDFFSCKAWAQQIVNRIDGTQSSMKENAIMEENYTLEQFRERASNVKAQKILSNRFHGIKKISQNPFQRFEEQGYFNFNQNISLGNNLTKTQQSSLILSAFGLEYLNETNNDHMLIGVPVPNRTRHNKDIITSAVITFPVLISRKNNFVESYVSIKRQLLENLRLQFFDYTRYFPSYCSFPIMFTYYTSNYSMHSIKTTIKLEKYFTIDPPSPVHIMLDSQQNVFGKIDKRFFEEDYYVQSMKRLKEGIRYVL